MSDRLKVKAFFYLKFGADAPITQSPCNNEKDHVTIKMLKITASSSPFGLFHYSGVATAYHHFPHLSVFNVKLLQN